MKAPSTSQEPMVVEEGESLTQSPDNSNYSLSNDSGLSCASTPVKSRRLSYKKSMSLTDMYEEDGYSDQRLGDEPISTLAEERLLGSPSSVKSSGLSQDKIDISMEDSINYEGEGSSDQQLGDKQISAADVSKPVRPPSTDEYDSFIRHILDQVTGKKRKFMELQYEMLTNLEGKCYLFYYYFIGPCYVLVINDY